MISKQPFGKTGHGSTRTIFGGAAFWEVTQDEADRTLELLLKYGVNHIDTAASYGDSELRIGPWMKEYRKDFFLATKTGERTYQKAKEELHKSLDRLKTDHVDLWQMHNLINTEERETALKSGGSLEALIEAKEEGLTRFIGITGHGLAAPARHYKSLQQYKFDSILLPYNYILMQNPNYADDFNKLVQYCNENQIAVQTIKSLAKGALENKESKYAVWYDPIDEKDAIINSVNWVLGTQSVFLNTVGDINLLPIVLEAAENFDTATSDEEMDSDVQKYGITSLFKGDEI